MPKKTTASERRATPEPASAPRELVNMADIMDAKRQLETLEQHLMYLEHNDGKSYFWTSFKGHIQFSAEITELALATEKAKTVNRIAEIKQKFKGIGLTFAQNEADFGSWKV